MSPGARLVWRGRSATLERFAEVDVPDRASFVVAVVRLDVPEEMAGARAARVVVAPAEVRPLAERDSRFARNSGL